MSTSPTAASNQTPTTIITLRTFAISFSNILDAQPALRINLSWLPATKGPTPFRLKVIAAETVHQACIKAQRFSPPTNKVTTTQQITPGSNNRMAKQLNGSPTTESQKIFSLKAHVATGIRLLTGHAFTGKYTAHFRPSSFDPRHCQCGEPRSSSVRRKEARPWEFFGSITRPRQTTRKEVSVSTRSKKSVRVRFRHHFSKDFLRISVLSSLLV
jgi:hypothetical protein